MGPVIIFMGPTGSGKSLQARLLSEKHDYHYVSTGDILRASDDPEIVETLDDGRLADSEKIKEILTAALNNLSDGKTIVLDGCVRIIEEAKWLDKFLAEKNARVEKVFYLKVSEEVSLKRLHRRHRSDDETDVIENRWDDYQKITVPVIDFYRQHGVLIEVNGDQTPELVAREIEMNL